MKKFFLTVIALFFVISLFSQTIVSTTAENKNVILEEFTGIHCGYCPQGHAIAQAIKNAHPEDVFLINIHVGSYATPSAGEPDFRTTFGTSIANQSGLTGYPAGTVNRHLFAGLSQGSGTAMSRGNWTNAANQTLAASSYVNVGVEAEIDAATRTITVHVETYYTGNSTQTSNYLNVALLQNNTLGPQAGGNMGNEYVHMHRLVNMITGQWGEEITTTTEGTFVDKTYTYIIPEAYNSVEARLGDLEVVAFVAESHQEIISGNGCTPTYLNCPDDVVIKQVISDPAVCGNYVTPIVKIDNLSSSPITSLTFEYSVNEGDVETFNWTGSIEALQQSTIELPELMFVSLETNTINVEITDIDDNLDNNLGTSTFENAVQVTETVYLELHTDGYGEECSWNVKNSAGTTMYSGSNYADNSTFNFTFELPADCYTFNLIDSYGDGGGAVTLEDGEGTQIFYTSGTYGLGSFVNFGTYLLATPEGVYSVGTENVAIDEAVTLTFNVPVRLPDNTIITDPSALITFTNNDAKSDVAFTSEISEDNTLITITPDANLTELTSYTILMASGSVESFSDILLENDVTVTFTTEETVNVDNSQADVNFYPNPAKDYLMIKNAENSVLKIYNISGSVVYEVKINENNFKINTSELKSGIYILNISNGNTNFVKELSILK